MNFPNRTTAIGSTINSYLKSSLDLPDESVHLLFSSNRWECNPSILDALRAGKNVVCDRYAYSGVAFTHSKPDGPSLEWCKAPDVGLVSPDAVVFLSVDATTAEARGGFGDERYENTTHQLAVREAFEKLRVEDEGNESAPEWFVIDAARTVEEVKKEIEGIVEGVKEKRKGEAIRKLWKAGTFD